MTATPTQHNQVCHTLLSVKNINNEDIVLLILTRDFDKYAVRPDSGCSHLFLKINLIPRPRKKRRDSWEFLNWQAKSLKMNQRYDF